MIQVMRKNAATIMWIVIIAFIATIVFAWGMDLSGNNVRHSSIGKVNGKEIPVNSFEQMVSQEQEKARTQSKGGDISPAQSRMLPYQVWESEVSRMLLTDAISKMQIGATADQVFDYIMQNMQSQVAGNPQFQTNGTYDPSKFAAFLSDPRSYNEPGLLQLELQTRQVMVPMQTLQVLLSFQGNLTPCEIAYEYKTKKAQSRFEYAKVNAAGMKIEGSEITEAAITKYYKENEKKFTAANELADLYVVTVPKIATAADEQAIYNELLESRTKINNNDSLFQEEAKITSDDNTTASEGGSLGTISKGTMVPQFDSVAFSLPVHVVSMPVKTMYGYHLVYVESREMKDGKDVATVRHILRKITPMPETIDRIAGHVDSIQKLATTDGIMAVKKLGVAVDSSGLFQRGQMAQSLMNVSGAGGFAFNHTVGEVSDVMESEAGFFILAVKQKIAKGLLPMDMFKDGIAQMIADSLRLVKAKTYLEGVQAKAPDKNAVAQYSAIDPAVLSGTTDTATCENAVPEIGVNNKVIAVAMALPVGSTSHVIMTKDAAYIVKPIWQNPVTTVPMNSPEVMQIRQTAMQQASQRIFYDWTSSLKNRAKIINNVAQFYID